MAKKAGPGVGELIVKAVSASKERSGTLVQVKGTGASGSFKLNKQQAETKEHKSAAAKKPAAKKSPKKAKKPAAKAATKATKSPKKAKKPAVAKKPAKSPKKAKTVKPKAAKPKQGGRGSLKSLKMS
ncbi:hypothetical protein PO909_021209 [Leuciscus waleckii]